MSEPIPYLKSYLFFLLMIGIGSFMGVPRILGAIEGHAAKSWPSVQGEVTRLDVNLIASKRTRYGKVSAFKVSIEYAYTLEGTDYTGCRFTAGDDGTIEEDETHWYSSGYCEGKKTKVYYNPDDPASCVLKPGQALANIYMMIIGIAVLIIGIAGFIFTRKFAKDYAGLTKYGT